MKPPTLANYLKPWHKPVPLLHVFWASMAGLYGGSAATLAYYHNTPAALLVGLASIAFLIALARKPKAATQ